MKGGYYEKARRLDLAIRKWPSMLLLAIESVFRIDRVTWI
jgi:hypothetical protein